MIFLKWLHRRQDEELLKTAEQVLKDFRNEISSMAVCGEEREVLENMIFLLLNTYMEEDEKKFLCDTDGRSACPDAPESIPASFRAGCASAPLSAAPR